MSDAVLATIDKARQALLQARSVLDAKKVADMAHAAEVYAKRQKCAEETIQHATAIKVDSMALMGEFLKNVEKNRGGNLATLKHVSTGSQVEPVDTLPTLAEVGITKKESMYAQSLATLRDVQPESFEKVRAGRIPVAKAHALLRQATPADAVVVESSPTRTADSLNALIAQGTKFGTIYADPPWAYSNQATRAATGNHYDTLTLDQLCELPVRELARDKSHLWLWTTNGFLFECPRLFDAWGFVFKSSYVWVKPQMGIGNYLRNSHEFLLMATRGGLVGEAKDVKSWGEFDRTRHSAKPEQIRARVVERVSPGPRLELFGRKVVPGWTVWGNQIAADGSLFGEEADHITEDAA